MFPGQKVIDYGNKTTFVVPLYLDNETLTCFVFFLVSEALLRCRVDVVAKLNNCSMPSSELLLSRYLSPHAIRILLKNGLYIS